MQFLLEFKLKTLEPQGFQEKISVMTHGINTIVYLFPVEDAGYSRWFVLNSTVVTTA